MILMACVDGRNGMAFNCRRQSRDRAVRADLLAEIEAGTAYYDLVEVMTCKTGCVGGAGQPYGLLPAKHQRAEGLYEADRTALIKRSERNPIVTKLLEGALKGRTHQLLHVEYKRPDKA